ncbi:MAG: hypothetical protein K0S06_4414 [Microvirga sp.]|jgi:hypothetical protein|nr:hypothetical protein [Microvirga sp.]
MALTSNSAVSTTGWTTRAVFLGAQVVLGLACLVGAFASVTWALSSATEPAAPEVRFAKLENWPDIKGGVPERVPPAEPNSLGSESRLAAASRATGAQQSTSQELPLETPQAGIPAEDAAPPTMRNAELSRDTPLPHGIRAHSSAAPMSVAPAGQEAASSFESRGQPLPASTPIGDTGVMGVVQESGGQSAGSPVKEAALRTAATAASPISEAASPKDRQPNRVERSGRPASAVRRTAVERAKGEPRASAVKIGSAPQARKARPARTRTAAKTSPSTDPAPAPTPPAEAREDRVHLLGVPLPSGRKVRECLLEFRC